MAEEETMAAAAMTAAKEYFKGQRQEREGCDESHPSLIVVLIYNR